jgi:hemolysin activation/secretion protein
MVLRRPYFAPLVLHPKPLWLGRVGGWLRMLLGFPFALGLGMSAAAAPATLYIAEYRVHGAHALSRLEIETAVYPFLGPDRTEEDVKAACAALEKAYRAKGFGAVSVRYAAAVGKGGVVHLQVSEGTVARLRV